MRKESMVSLDAETRRIVRILMESQPKTIIHFGSSYRGNPHKESDIDLCLIMYDTKGVPAFRIAQQLRKQLWDHGYRFPVPVDLHIYSQDEYEERLRHGDPFIAEIARGEVLYDKTRSVN